MSLLTVQSTAGVAVEFIPEAYKRRDDALVPTLAIVAVTTPKEQATAVAALRGLKAISKEVEASRKAAKAPVLDLGKRVDAIAEQFVAPVAAEEARLTELLTNYQVAQQRIRDEEARIAQADADRLAAEERKKADGLREQRAEAERELAAAREAAGNAETKEELATARIAVEAALRRVLDLGGRIESANDAAVVAQAFPAPVPKAAAPAGLTAKQPWTFEILDLKAFAAACPDLVEISPKRSAILAMIRDGARQLPHARIFQEVRISVRA